MTQIMNQSVRPSAEMLLPSRDEAARANRVAAFRWGSLVVALLFSQILIGVAAIVLANNDPTVAVVPGYHQQAILWDESVQLRDNSRAMGWTVQHTASGVPGGNQLRWAVTDRDGKDIQDLQGRVLLYHHARANEPIELKMEEHPEGILLNRTGLWQVEMTLTRGSDTKRFFDMQLVDVKRAQ